MIEKEDRNEIKINQILNIVKIAALSFPAIAFLQYFTVNHSNMQFFLQSGLMLALVLSVILIIYVFWIFLQLKISKRLPFKDWIDLAIPWITAFISVMLTGSYESDYKFLFLLVIISSCIEYDRKVSLYIATFTSVTILGIDLICAPKTSVNTYFESDIVIASVFLLISWTIGYYVDLRKKHIENLKDLANIDGLTGLYNHRYFYDILTEELNKCKNNGNELSLLFIDIDNFKIYNDLYGHQKGDEVLRIISGIMKDTAPKNSLVVRYGGEEFAILFPDTSEAAAMQQAEALRKKIQDYIFEGEENLPGGHLTISAGISTYPTKAKTDSDLIKYADQACYRAKYLYKNRVETYLSILDQMQYDLSDIDSEKVVSIKTLIAVINAKDKYTYGHVDRVVFYCTLLAEELGLTEADKQKLIYSAYLHDIGKINIPGDVLVKTERLTNEEWEILKQHPQKAVEIIQNINSLKDIIPIVLQHHERYDGAGYPSKLKGEEIHYLARALSVADSFDAMTSIRPYQPKKTYEQGIEELIRCSGTQFDPEIVKSFIRAINKKKQAMV